MCAYSKQMGFGQLHQRVLFCAKNTCFVVVVVVAFLQPLLSYGLVGDGWECLWISVGHCEFLSQFVRLLVAAHAYACTCMPACLHVHTWPHSLLLGFTTTTISCFWFCVYLGLFLSLML